MTGIPNAARGLVPERVAAGKPRRPRPRRTTLAAALLVVVVAGAPAGCRGDRPGPPRSSADDCDFPTASGPGVVGGPLGDPEENAQTWGLRRPAAGLQDAAVIELRNDGPTPVLLEEARLTPEPGSSPVRLTGAYVAPGRGRLRFRSLGAAPGGPDLAGYCLPPRGPRRPPVLVLRIGPSLPEDIGGRPRSRNNNVNLVYRTPDGVRHVAVYSTQFVYRNLRERGG